MKVKMVGDNLHIAGIKWARAQSLEDTLAVCVCDWAGVNLEGSLITASKWRGKYNSRRQKTA